MGDSMTEKQKAAIDVMSTLPDDQRNLLKPFFDKHHPLSECSLKSGEAVSSKPVQILTENVSLSLCPSCRKLVDSQVEPL